MNLFITCPKGLEGLLMEEVQGIIDGKMIANEAFQPGSSHDSHNNLRMTASGVHLEGRLEDAYKLCLWSRLANRVLLPLHSDKVETDYDLYSAAISVEWEAHLSPDATIAIDFVGTNRSIKSSQFGAMRVKDALVDRMRDKTGVRPSVDKRTPDIRVNVRLAKGKAHFSLDLSGESLHQRGYRSEQGAAPLKENLAAALLYRANWPAIAKRGGSLIDPMCGSGTFLIEAALIAGNIAPGIMRKRFGFSAWSQHDEKTWRTIYQEAQALKDKAFEQGIPELRGYDINPYVIEKAEMNIANTGLEKWVHVMRKPVSELKKTTHSVMHEGLVICNPPYGERLGDIDALRETYRSLGFVCKQEFPGWQLAVFTGNQSLGKELRLRSNKKYKFLNGTIDSELLLFDLLSKDEATLRADVEDSGKASASPYDACLKKTNAQDSSPGVISAVDAQEVVEEGLSSGAEMVANRLRKNLKRLGKWVKNLESNCYRVYDADMPEYAAAIDFYDGAIHVQEYAPPKKIDEHAAAKRLDELMSAAAEVFDVPKREIFLKVRRRNKGKQQYEKNNSDRVNKTFTVTEGKAKLHVNLEDYLDTGLFLDHRPLRLKIAEEALGKKFLNLFCYTASSSVHAALGGAKETLSVDMSKTYLDWAKRNFELNSISEKKNTLVQSDCMTWLASCREGFDLIMLDPPSFSNSKRMNDVFDVQRDHVKLVKRCMELLNPGGVLYFSNNLQSFKLDKTLIDRFNVVDIREATLDKDFERNKKIHCCFKITN